MKRHTRKQRGLHRSTLRCALASCLALSTAAVHAQSANATLRGRVAGAQAGTTVTATNTADGSVRRTQTNADGSYTLVGLAPGTYTVDAGAGSAQTVRLSVASTATLNLAPDTGVAEAPAAEATDLDAVTVTAPALQEINTSEVGENISLRQIQTVPQASRNFLEFADSVPGMVFERSPDGRTTLKSGTQNTTTTNLYIDGVGQKSYVKKGGVAGQVDSAGNPFPQSAIGEYKVITSNYKAEYGQVSSAAVTAVTKSGTNDLHGEVFYRYTDQDMREKTPAEEAAGGDKPESSEKEYGFSAGGPIIQDRMHFFFTVEKKEFALPTAVVPGSAAPAEVVAQLPEEARAKFGPAVQPFDEELFFGKVDWDITDNDHIAVSAQWRDEVSTREVGNQTAYERGVTVDNYDHRYSLRWEHNAENWFNEVLATSEDSFNKPIPITIGNGIIYTTPDPGNPDADASIIATGGGDPRAGQVKGQKGWSIEDNLTLYGLQWLGDHTIKMGVRYKDVDLAASDALNANPQFTYGIGSSFTPDQPYKADFPLPYAGGSIARTVETSARQVGLYIQDDWQVNEHLLLNLGIRWDYEEVPAYLDFVTPPEVVDALNSEYDVAPPGQTYADTLALAGVDINDYISNGKNREAFKDGWQPRLGFSYDINADEKHVIHGGAGRSYDRNVYDFLQLEVTKLALSVPVAYFRDPATGGCYRGFTPCFDWDPAYLGDGGLELLQGLLSSAGEINLLHNELKTPYSDQFSIGMSNQIGDWLTDATVTRVLSYDGFQFNLGNRYPNGNYYDDANLCDPNADPGAPPGERRNPFACAVPGFGVLLFGQNGIKTRSTQVLLSAQKPYTAEDGWGLSLAYTFTNAKQNRDQEDHYSFDYPTVDYYPTLVSKSVPRHRFVAAASLDGFWGITFGGKLTLATPQYVYTNVTQDPPPEDPNLSGSPPRARKPGGTLGYRSLDLQATKEFDLGGIQLYGRLDLLNAFNWKNYDYEDVIYFDQDGAFNPRYNTAGDIVGVPRTVKFEVGMRF